MILTIIILSTEIVKNDKSYACVDDSLASEFNHIKRSMNIINNILAKKVLAPKDVTWSISPNTMTNDQARAYCYSRDQWLANPDNFNELETGVCFETIIF